MSIWGGAEGSKTGFFCILYCMFLHVTNQYLVNIVHPTSCLLSFFVLDSSMPTLLFSRFCRNALILLQLLQKILYRNLSFLDGCDATNIVNPALVGIHKVY